MRRILITLFMLGLVNESVAHQLVVSTNSYLTGFQHPVLGLDHFLAMLSVGIISAQIGGKAIWTIPLTFLVVMTAGGMLGMSERELPFVETGIALSVLLLGVAISIGRSAQNEFYLIAMLFVAGFGLFHGYAHGVEMPYVADPVIYATGFVTATAIIHVVGVLIGMVVLKYSKKIDLLRVGGVLIFGAGLYFLAV